MPFCNYKKKGFHSLDEISKKSKLFLSLTKFQHISANTLSTPTGGEEEEEEEEGHVL